MKTLIASCLAPLIFLVGCATTMNSGSQCPVSAEYFEDMATFAWKPTGSWKIDDATGFISPLIERQLKQEFVNAMQAKGFRLVDNADEGELLVVVSLTTRRELQSFDVESNNCPDCWEPVAPSSNVRMTMQTVGFLAFDAYSEGEPVWRSWVERNLYPSDRDNAQEVLKLAIPKLLDDFPPNQIDTE